MSTTSAPAPTGRDHAGRLGLPAATALIMGGIIGTGVFTLPASIAAYGWMAIIALVVVSVGALMLALMFGSLAKREPDAGGPYAYARHAFGDFAGFTTAWPYWITAWAGNAAIVVGWTFYVEALFGWDDVPWTTSAIIAMVGLWLPAAINLVGVRSMGAFQIVTTILKLGDWWDAEQYHQDFFAKNPNQGYCLAVALPKVNKIRKSYAQYVKAT